MRDAFDVVIVGSGFGGAVVAHRLAREGLRVCVLERGKAYPPGSFPRAPIAMRTNFWDPSAGLHGLFDVWSFQRFAAVVASGLGGGSLIYANVLLRKDEGTFVDADGARWPLDRRDLDPHYDAVEALLRPTPYPIEAPDYRDTPKTLAFRAAAEASAQPWFAPPLAIAFSPREGEAPRAGEPVIEDVPNRYGRTRSTCRMCGECNVGCNYGSKSTLDLTLLSRAERDGAELRTHCDVREILPRDDGFLVRYAEHAENDACATRELPLRAVTGRRVVVAAGTFGSTRLLLRNRTRLGIPSPRLGDRISGNGDLLTYLWKAQSEGKPRRIDATRGPVITTAIRNDHDFYLEDAGFPAFLAWMVEGSDPARVAARTLRFAARVAAGFLGLDADPDLGGALAHLLGDAAGSGSSLPLLAMGRDAADGKVSLDAEERLRMDWTIDATAPLIERARKASTLLARAMGGELRDDPLYHLSRVITVHPLGGCSMGRDASDGVVDAYGRVFGVPGLYVADGSVLRGAVGANPALTIAALADRTADALSSDLRSASLSSR